MRASFRVGIVCAAVVASVGCGSPDASSVSSRDAGAALSSQPAAVPADYVPTPNGYFHPSCIVALEPGEVLGRDRVVRGKDGTARRTIPACAYPRFTANGRRIAPETPPRILSTADGGDSGLVDAGVADAGGDGSGAGDAGAPPYYDGWLIAYFNDSPLPADPALTLTGKWVVPPSPTNGAPSGNNQLQVLFFNGIETAAQIVQPVLGYWGGNWNIESVTCCGAGLTARGAVLPVNPGDVIEGITAGRNCDVASRICQGWTVTTTDLTTGQSSVLNASALDGPPTYVVPAVLETFGVDACDMLPPGGEETFFDTMLTAGDAGAQTLTYQPQVLPELGAPACGYRGISSGNSYSLIYSSGPLGYATTTTSLSASPSGTFAGADVALAATVTSTATSPSMEGKVSFYDGKTLLGAVDVAAATDAGGHATASAALSAHSLPGGVHTLTAAYRGSFNYGSSTSAASTVALVGWPTSTALDASPPTSTEGTPSHLVATVTSSAPGTVPALGGTVHFYNGSAAIGSVPLAPASDGGASPLVAVLDVPALTVGSDSLTASFDGDAYHAASASVVSVLTVTSSLALTPVAATVPPRGTLVLTTTAGVSPIAWTLGTNTSGATINWGSGAYVAYTAGPAGGGSDVIVATDSAGATATGTVTVGPGVSIAPQSPSIATGGAIAFHASGGSDAGYGWSLTGTPSGGSIDTSSGAYRAGAIGGVTDVVAVTDPLGNVATAPITVVASGDAGTEPDAGPGIQPGSAGAGCSCDLAPFRGPNNRAGEVGALVLALAATRRRSKARKSPR